MFLRYSATLLFVLCCTSFALGQPGKTKKPNVIIVMTDDQGHGDLGFHGNPVIKTPNLDRFAKQSVRMKNFHVSPVCAPTRASLMTGRYNYRTGVVDTFLGRAMMHTDEITLAEILRALGYRTGIFGKWHLGDNYPLRAIDQGFEEALVLKGGGIGQPSDPPGGESYFNPILQHNGKAVKKDGYCTDIFTDAALDFIGKNKGSPFLCYVAFNCPHGPLEVPKKYLDVYKDKIKLEQFPKVGFPVEGKVDLDATAKIYGMISNIDDNFARLLAKLDELGIADDTIVIFLTDNGPQQPRYVSGMRGRKGTVFEGGTHVPFFVRWPAQLPKDRDIETVAAHIDIAPTLVAACGGAMPKDRTIDGVNLLALWKGEKTSLPERTLFFQWHRGDVPEMYRAFATRSSQYRLVQPQGVQEKQKYDKTKLMLFDISKDPYESKNLAAQNPEVVATLKKQYEAWFKDVESTRKFAPPRIIIGADQESPTILTRQDWRGPAAGWTPTSVGHWDLDVRKAGRFEVTATLPAPLVKDAVMHVKIGGHIFTKKLVGDMGKTAVVGGIPLPIGPVQLEAWIAEGDSVRGMRFVAIRRE